MAQNDLTNILLPYQKKWIECNSKYAIYLKSRRIGITFAEALWSIRRRVLLKEDHWFVSTKEDVALEFIRYCVQWAKIINILCNGTAIDLSKATQNCILMPNGSRITSMTSSPDGLRGLSGSVTLDEFAIHEHAEELYISSAPVIQWGGCLRIISTPNNNDTTFDKLYNDNNNDFVKFRTTLIDATDEGLALKVPGDHQAFLPDKTKCTTTFIDNIKRNCLNEYAFRQEYMCEKVSWQGLIYPSFADEKSPEWPVIPTLAKLPSPAVKVAAGLDYGWGDPLAFYIGVLCENDIVYVTEEFYGSKISIPEQGQKIKALIAKWSIRVNSQYSQTVKGGFFESVFCDSSRPEITHLLRTYDIPIKNKRIQNIEARISITDQAIKAGRVKIFDCCTNLIRECRTYSWGKNNDPKKGQSDHGCDSFSYLISSWFVDRAIQPAPVLPPKPTEEQTLEVGLRLSQVEDKKDFEARQKKELEEKRNRHMIRLAHADDPD